MKNMEINDSRGETAVLPKSFSLYVNDYLHIFIPAALLTETLGLRSYCGDEKKFFFLSKKNFNKLFSF